MPQVEIYTSSNGDTWCLCKNEAGHVYVVHEPNKASGGKASAVGLGEFLSQASTGPEHEALLRMIGGLADQKNT